MGSKPAKISNSRIRNWYKKGFNKAGEVKPDRLLPKARLTQREAFMFSLITAIAETKDKAQTMRYLLDAYNRLGHNDKLETSTCSATLHSLNDNGFVSMIGGKTAKINKQTEEVKTTSKAKFYLSDDVKRGRLFIDGKRWVVIDDRHIAPVEIRLKIEEKERTSTR